MASRQARTVVDFSPSVLQRSSCIQPVDEPVDVAVFLDGQWIRARTIDLSVDIHDQLLRFLDPVSIIPKVRAGPEPKGAQMTEILSVDGALIRADETKPLGGVVPITVPSSSTVDRSAEGYAGRGEYPHRPGI